MGLVEEMAFAIAWEELERDRVKNRRERYMTFRVDVPDWLAEWIAAKQKQFGLTRITNVLRILGNARFYLSESHEVCDLPGILELFCAIPRSIKLLAMVPNKSAFIWALSGYMSDENKMVTQTSLILQNEMNFFWEELAKTPLAKSKEALLSVLHLLDYISPDEILRMSKSEYWVKVLMNHDDYEFRNKEAGLDKKRYYEIMLHTPAIRAADTRFKRMDAVKLIMNKEGADRYLNVICCDPFLRREFGFDFALRTADQLEDPGMAADVLRHGKFDNNAQKAGMVRFIAYSGGNSHFLKILDKKISMMGSDEFDQLLISTPLQAAGRICNCDEAERIATAFRNIGTASVILGQSIFCGHDFMIEAVLKHQKALLRYLGNGELTVETVSYLCRESDCAKPFLYLNAWGARDINTLAKTNGLSVFKKYRKEILSLGQKFGKNTPYTYQEIQSLNDICSSETGYYQRLNIFFALLGRLRSEEACLRICQFSKKYREPMTTKEVENVIDHLSQGDLPTMSSRLLSVPVSEETAARVMTTSAMLEPVLRAATNETEIVFAIENPGICKNGLREGMKHFLDKDDMVQKAKEDLDLPDEFYQKHKDTVWKFFISGGGWYVHNYMKSLSNCEAFKVVVKAAMCDQLNELRYTDLERECCMSISDSMRTHWFHDDVRTIDGYQVYEDTTFQGIMNLGAVPTRTCMNYIDGMHRECLLAYFDGNKKIIYVKRNGTVIARAVIRLTKTANQLVNWKKECLNFTDVTDDNTVKAEKSIPFIETPIIFLERCYSGIQGRKRQDIESAIIRFAAEKASEIGCGFLVSGEYHETVGNTSWDHKFKFTQKSIFITKSKAGRQYLDSFGGIYSNRDSYYAPENIYVIARCFCDVSLVNTEDEEQGQN